MYCWWRFTPLFSLITTITISPLPLFVAFVVLTRERAHLLLGNRQGSRVDSASLPRLIEKDGRDTD